MSCRFAARSLVVDSRERRPCVCACVCQRQPAAHTILLARASARLSVRSLARSLAPPRARKLRALSSAAAAAAANESGRRTYFDWMRARPSRLRLRARQSHIRRLLWRDRERGATRKTRAGKLAEPSRAERVEKRRRRVGPVSSLGDPDWLSACRPCARRAPHTHTTPSSPLGAPRAHPPSLACTSHLSRAAPPRPKARAPCARCSSVVPAGNSRRSSWPPPLPIGGEL